MFKPEIVGRARRRQSLAGYHLPDRCFMRTNLTQLDHPANRPDRNAPCLSLSSDSQETPIAALPRDTQEQMEQQTLILTELIATLSVLDAHMQQLKTDMTSSGG